MPDGLNNRIVRNNIHKNMQNLKAVISSAEMSEIKIDAK